jgi:hypothetical protein
MLQYSKPQHIDGQRVCWVGWFQSAIETTIGIGNGVLMDFFVGARNAHDTPFHYHSFHWQSLPLDVPSHSYWIVGEGEGGFCQEWF